MNVRLRTRTTQLKKLNAIRLDIIKDTMENHADNGIAELQVYPPERPNSSYVRTGRLGRSWRRDNAHVVGDRLVINISNDATDPRGIHYAERVHGDEQGANQWEIHEETGWPLAAEVLREGYADRMRRAIKRAL